MLGRQTIVVIRLEVGNVFVEYFALDICCCLKAFALSVHVCVEGNQKY